jgi:uncharacterized protein
MPLKVNIRLLPEDPVRLQGELAVPDFAADFDDALVQFVSPLRHDLTVERQDDALLVMGSLEVELKCGCARCLKTFSRRIRIPDYAALIPLEGEDAAPRDGDFVDLTASVREDTFLALPTKPLCRPDCRGLAQKASTRDSRLKKAGSQGLSESPWAALDKLKL